MTSSPTDRRVRPLALAALLWLAPPLPAQLPAPRPHHPPAKPPILATNTGLIVIDAAHGGTDDGATLPTGVLEKNLTQTFSERLRTQLVAHGFNVVLSRNLAVTTPTDNTETPSVAAEDQRAEQANRLRPLACLLLHATSGGHGVHLFTSSLAPFTASHPAPSILPWNAAQATTVPQSLQLATDLATALNDIRIPLVLARASVPPIDSLTCPAIAVELAPLTNAAVTDAAYQARVADAIASGLSFWRGHLEAEIARVAEETAAESETIPEPTAKKPKKPSPATTQPGAVR
ncbi:N-acetylmuramoyl-L-alanine amidase [Granulicella sp. WH15]|uniref:N-acetylmuramoyl-L-alanine amidase family protein n=1 Tax=Granulicella sp. WH15 TaxID=2602070 RepID=UPI0013A59805|nr:N-acetylmuramoyl-L-alanine amidase [Granulicella sp. WH15]